LNTRADYVLRVLALSLLYVAGAGVATWFVHGPDQVALIWPPAGIGFIILLIDGLVFWPFIVIGVVVLHATLAPVPMAFVPFSIAANTLSALAAAWMIRREVPRVVNMLTVRSGFRLLRAALVLVLISALIGTAGLVYAGMVPMREFGPSAMRWAMGDLFGAIAVGPALLVARLFHARPERLAPELRYGGTRERIAWSLVLPLTLLAVLAAGQRGTGFALGASALPMVALLWSALRFPPGYALIGTMITALFVATVVGLGFSGFAPPTGLVDTVILLAFLCVCANIPQIVVAAIHESRLAAARLLRRATIDALTGLLNRTAFEDNCRQAMQARPDETMALVYLDLDQFKLANDTSSHAAGDELIQGIAGVLRSQQRPDDLLARTGGDEFAVLLRDVDAAAAEAEARRLGVAIAQYRAAYRGQALSATASLGVVPFRAGGADFGALLARADAACFTAKELGGNRVQIAHLGEAAVEERTNAMQWAIRLRSALDEDRFLLYCQTIAPLRTPAEAGRRRFEILLRLTDPLTGAVLAPAQFVAAAERFKLGVRLDRYVVERTLNWLERNPSALAQVECCSINLTAAALSDEEFASWLRGRIARAPIGPERFCFEITETSAVRDLAHAQHLIQSVRALGCKFALDDFGAGFCSFAYLKALDVDYFKIDGSFVREVAVSPLSLAIVRSIAEIARVLRRQTVAEFAETDTIRQHLLALGVDYAQGFAIDEPMPIERYFALPPATAEPPLLRSA